jgi:hypothetical protein
MSRLVTTAVTHSQYGFWFASLLTAMSCGRVIGIESAKEDPSFHPGQAGAANGGAGGDAPTVSCDDYCDTVMANCRGDFAVYTSLSTCLAVCATLPIGTDGDDIGNSVACRLRNARLARSTAEPEVHCPIAGPGGFDTCGADCEGYCVVFRSACSVAFSTDFESNVDCVRACRDLPSPEQPFDVSQNSGPTVNCRLWHVSAATLDPGTHCPHAAGAAPCDG